MKKLSYLLFAGALLGMVSCSNDELAPNLGGDGNVSFCLNIPQTIGTRAINQGDKAVDLKVAVFNGDSQSGDYKKYMTTIDKPGIFVNGTANVNLDLVQGKKYILAFWAQSPDSPYTFDDGIVNMNYGGVANNDHRDAFFTSTTITVGETYTASLTLSRPFAQVNFGASDYEYALSLGLSTDNTSSVSYTAELMPEFNLCSGEAQGTPCVASFTTALFPGFDTAPSTLTVGGTDYSWVSMNYLLPAESGSVISETTLNINGVQNPIKFQSAPIKRNFRTNITGKLFTTSTGFDLTIDSDFGTPDINLWDGKTLTVVTPVTKNIDGNDVAVYEVATGSELAYMAQNVDLKNAYIELTGDVDLGGNEWTSFGAVGRKDNENMFTGTFDGSGHTIKNFTVEANGDEQCAALIASANNAIIKNVTIEGGSVKATDTAAGLVAFIQGETTVENCHVNVNISNIYENPGSQIIGSAIGGVVGRVYGENCVIKNCTVSGNITGTSGVNAQSKIGGIVGFIGLNKANGLQIINCTNNANISGTSDFGMGGIVGGSMKSSYVTITGCINNGNITNNYTSVAPLTGAGGILGCAQSINFDGNDDHFVITNCTNNGEIKGYNSSGVGQIIGACVNATFDISTCTLNGSATVLP